MVRSASTRGGSKVYKAIDLFAGIGGIRLGFEQAFNGGIDFVWANEKDEACLSTYKANFEDDIIDGRDINEVTKDITSIPDHDILLGGFPCQPFSIAGFQEGFTDKTRGTLFYNIVRILEQKKPEAFLLENVAFFQHHDHGRTWRTVRSVLERELGYAVYSETLNARDFGLPQNRPRFFMVGFRDKSLPFNFPKPLGRSSLKGILQHNVGNKYYISQRYLNSMKEHRRRHEAAGHGFGYIILEPEGIANTLVVGGMGHERNLIKDSPPEDCWSDGEQDLSKPNSEGVRRLTPREYARLQGFPDDYRQVVSDTQAYKQFANSVPVAVVKAIAGEIKITLEGSRDPRSNLFYWAKGVTQVAQQ